MKNNIFVTTMFLPRLLFLIITTFFINSLPAQDRVRQMALSDMSDFKNQAGNWKIVGDVTMDPRLDMHQWPKVSGKKGPNKKNVSEANSNEVIIADQGKGILLNTGNEQMHDNLITTFEHGDIELEFDVMLPKGSNSGIYLQGRYEVQLFDSWGVKNPQFSDMGGIYRNWEKEPDKSYPGNCPLSNPAKAPGLWQTMKISFRSPKFDQLGKKIANARFDVVELNGIIIHNNVEVSHPTGGAIENNEVPMGPLLIQGDHGPVAFRNIHYRLMTQVNFLLSAITYKAYYGKFKSIDDFISRKPDESGPTPELTCDVLHQENGYGISFSGNLTVPAEGLYEFRLVSSGGGRVVINGQQLMEGKSPDGHQSLSASMAIKAGIYPFEIYNFKDAAWMPPRLGLYVQSQTSYPQPLHAFNSMPSDREPDSPIFLDVGSEPKLLRAFLDFKGDRKQRLTHTVGVGDPSGIHYVYDLKSGNMVCAWHGQFVDATPMWHDRGDGSFRPRGAVQYLFNNQPLAFLASEREPFPIILTEATTRVDEYRAKGYVVERSTGRPTFRYTYRGMEIEDKIYPEDGNRAITHEVQIKNRGTKGGLYYKLGEGSNIVALPGGLYALDDKQYYIKVTDVVPIIREVNGRKELIVAMDSTIKYAFIW